MIFRRHLLYTAIVCTPVLSLQAAADDFGFEEPEVSAEEVRYDNWIDLGVGHVSDDNGKFGEFSRPLAEDGMMAIGGIHLEQKNATVDLERTLYYTDGRLRYRVPGTGSVEVYGFNSQKIEMFNANIPESYDLDLADLGNYEPVTFAVERSTYGVSMSRNLATNWLLNLGFSRQFKEGDKTIAGPDHGPVVARTVDYEHDQLNLGMDYWNETFSLGVGYYLSDFTDNDTAYYWDNTAFDGAVAAEPDNEFQRFELDGNVRLGTVTNLNGIISWSEARQNDLFVATDPGLPDSLNGEVSRFFGRLTLTSRPTRQINYRLQYAVRDRDADHETWDLDYRRNNSIYGKDTESFKADAGYRFPNRSKLRAGMELETIERTREDVSAIWLDKTDEDTFWLEYRFAPVGKLKLRTRYEIAERDGLQEQNPDWISIYNTDRDLERFNISGTLPISDFLALGGGWIWTKEDFDNGDNWVPAQTPDETYGLESRETNLVNLDLSYSPSRELSLSVYGLWQTFDWQQFGEKNYAGRAPRERDYWTANGEDSTTVVGLNINWQATSRLNLSTDIGVSNSEGDLASSGIYTALAPDGNPLDIDAVDAPYSDRLPTYASDAIRFNLKATWDYSPELTTYLRYVYERWDTEDYWWDGSLQEEMYFAWRAPNEAEHAVILGFKKRFK
jgi:MtrB/PioB family decaheme-associated outer membrane protein